MAKRRKRGRLKDHYWKFIKFKCDLAIYAKCSCGYWYPCYKGLNGVNDIQKVPDPVKLHPYCPYCGSKKKWYIDEIEYLDIYPWEYKW